MHCSLSSMILRSAFHNTVPQRSCIYFIISPLVDILAWRSTKTLCRAPLSFFFLSGECVVLFCFCNTQRSDALNVWNQRKRNYGGEGVHCVGAFLTGLSDNETDAGRDVFFGENIWNPLTTKEAYRESVPDAGKPTQRALQRFFWSSRSTSRASVWFDARAWKVSKSTSSCPKDKVLRFGQRCCRRPKKTGTMGQLYSSDAFFSYPTINSSRSLLYSALHHMWKPWSKQKKSVGSWFVAESASPFGGELSWK